MQHNYQSINQVPQEVHNLANQIVEKGQNCRKTQQSSRFQCKTKEHYKTLTNNKDASCPIVLQRGLEEIPCEGIARYVERGGWGGGGGGGLYVRQAEET